MHKHPLPEQILTCITAGGMLCLFMLQARVALDSRTPSTFSIERMNVAYGYGSPVCGDALQEAGEGCDDGDTTSGDGCSATCTVESGWSCSGVAPTSCVEVCGNGVATTSEQCDDGNGSNTDACLTTCVAAACGDGYIRAGVEDCEPPGVGTCNASCVQAKTIGVSVSTPEPDPVVTTVRQGPPSNCGNGVLEPEKGEQCDAGRFNGLSSDCDRWCGMTYCGDGTVQPTEECEPEVDQDGKYVLRTCGVKSCTAPICTTEGTCFGGCRWLFLPACRAVPLNTAASASSARSTALHQAASFVSTQSLSSHAQSSQKSSAATSISRPSLTVPVRIEPVSESSVSTAPVCGNGRVEGDEQCDDGTANNNATPNACRTSCVLPLCGDGVVDAGELCDDGNDVLGDGCTPACTRSTCGNGVLEHGEECDEGPRNNSALPDSCSISCLLPRCGDGMVDRAFGEACDNGAANSNTTPNHCRLHCMNPRCGDGVQDDGELCDDGNQSERDWCAPDCRPVLCGDGIIDWNESCDDGNSVNGDGCNTVCRTEIISSSFVDWLLRALRLPFEPAIGE